jgi:hypothetical protein
MTMPKTLAALPSSQYATLLDDVLGKLLDRPSVLVAASASTAPCTFSPPIAALLRSGCVDFHLTDCRTDGWRRVDREAAKLERTGALKHGRQPNSRLESRGAAMRSCGNVWNMEAITAARSVRKEQW